MFYSSQKNAVPPFFYIFLALLTPICIPMSNKNCTHDVLNKDVQITKESLNIFDAVRNGELENVRKAISWGSEVDKSNQDGKTLLMFASELGYQDIVVYLVDNGANINAQTIKNGAHALSFASKEGHLNIVQYLLSSGAKIDLKLKNGCSALITASLFGKKDVVEYLVNHGADINLKNNGNVDFLIAAIAKGHSPIVRYILENKQINIHTSEAGDSTLSAFAIHYNKTKIIELLLGYGSIFNQKLSRALKIDNQIYPKDSTPLHISAMLNNQEIVGILLLFKQGCTLAKNCNGETPDKVTHNEELIKIFKHPNAHRPISKKINEFYHRNVLNGADNQPHLSPLDAKTKDEEKKLEKIITHFADYDLHIIYKDPNSIN